MSGFAKTMRHVMVLFLAALVLLAGCEMSEEEAKDPPRGVTLNKSTITYPTLSSATQTVTTVTASVPTESGANLAGQLVWEFQKGKEALYEVIVDKGATCQFKVKAAGSFYVRAYLEYDGKEYSAYCSVSTEGALTSMSIVDESRITAGTWRLTIGGAKTFTAVLSPSSTEQRGVRWSVSDSSILSLEPAKNDPLMAVVTALKEGSATVTVTSTDNPDISASATVSAITEFADTRTDAAQISLGENSHAMLTESTWQTSATVLDGYGNVLTEGDVIWSSSDTGVATVRTLSSRRCEVTARSNGKCDITAVLNGKTTIRSIVSLTVTGDIEEITTSANYFAVVKGRSIEIPVGFIPSTTRQTGFTARMSSSSATCAKSATAVTVAGISEGYTNLVLASTSDPSVTKTVMIRVLASDSSAASTIAKVTLSASSLTLDPPYSTSQASLTATAYDAEGRQMSGEGISFTVSDQSVLSLNAMGGSARGVYLTPLKPGVARVTATSLSDSRVTATCTVNVGGSLTALTPSSDNLTLEKGKLVDVYVSPSPSNAVYRGVTWKSGNENVATVNPYDSGRRARIRAVGSGTTSVSYAETGGSVGGTISVHVTSVTPTVIGTAAYVQLDKASLSMRQDADPQAVTATVYDSNGNALPSSSVTWSVNSAGSKAVSLAVNGNTVMISPRNAGSAIVTATSADKTSLRTSCYVEVGGSGIQGKALRALHASSPTLTLVKGNSASVNVSYVPADTDDTGVLWSSSDRSIVGVAADPTVSDGSAATLTPYKAGTAVVTATSVSDADIQATFAVTVIEETTVQDDTISQVRLLYGGTQTNAMTTGIGRTLSRITASATYSDGTVRSGSSAPAMVWKVAPEDGITVVRKGDTYIDLATVKAGDYTVTASPAANPKASGSMTISVLADEEKVEDLRSISIASRSVTMVKGTSADIYYSTIPSNYDVTGIISVSSDDETVAYAEANGNEKSVKVYAVTPGDAVVTLAPAGHDALKATIHVYVVDEAVVHDDSVSRVTLDRYYLSWDLAQKAPPVITATVWRQGVAYSDGTYPVEWSIEDSTIGTLQENSAGKVSVIPAGDGKTGRTTITARSRNNPSATATCIVEVIDSSDSKEYPANPLRGLAVNPSVVSLEAGKGISVAASVYPAAASASTTVSWSMADTAVATVKPATGGRSATISGLAAGNTILTVTASEEATGRSYSVDVPVEVYAEPTLYAQSIRLFQGGTQIWSVKLSQTDDPVAVTASVYDQNGNLMRDSKVTWTPEEGATAVAPVSQTTESGNTVMISPGQAGTAIYRITADDNEDLYARLTVTVGAYDPGKALRALVPSASSLSLKPGAKAEVSARLVPNDAEDVQLVWTSTAPEYAAVQASEDGMSATVTAVAEGRANITVSSAADSTVSAVIPVIVSANAAEVVPEALAVYVDGQRSSVLQTHVSSGSSVISVVHVMSDGSEKDLPVAWSYEGTDGSYLATEEGNATLAIEPRKAGSSTLVKAASRLNADLTAQIYVRVYADDEPIPDTTLRMVVPEAGSVSLMEGSSVAVSYSTIPEASREAIMWTTGDSSVATVVHDAEAKTVTVTAAGRGETDIHAVGVGDTSVTASFHVVVTPSPSTLGASSIRLYRDGKKSNVVLVHEGDDPVTVEAMTVMDDGSEVALPVSWSVPEDAAGLSGIQHLEPNSITFTPSAANGGVTVTASAEGNPTVKANLYVRVYAKGEVIPEEGEIAAIVPESSSVMLLAGAETTVSYGTIPGNASGSVIWTTGDNSVATVTHDADAKTVTIKAVGRGSAAVNAVSASDPGVTASISVTVTAGATTLDVSSIRLYRDGKKDNVVLVHEGDEPVTIDAMTVMSDGSEEDLPVAWTFPDGDDSLTDIRHLERNSVTFTPSKPNPGIIVKAASTTDSAISANLYVRVYAKGEAIPEDGELVAIVPDSSTIRLEPEATTELGFTLVPENAEGTIVWSTSDSSVATASRKTGENVLYIVAHDEGSAVITGKCGEVAAEIRVIVARPGVTVDPEITSVTLDKTNLSFEFSSKALPVLTATVWKGGEADSSEEVVWTVRDKDIATIDANGRMAVINHASKAGVTYVTATARNNQHASASCLVEVTDIAGEDYAKTLTGIQLSASSLNMEKGRVEVVTATPVPATLAGKVSVTWQTTDASIAALGSTKGSSVQVSAEGAGTAYVLATMEHEGRSYRGILTVRVSESLDPGSGYQSVTLSQGGVSLTRGSKTSLTATAVKADGTTDYAAPVVWAIVDDDVTTGGDAVVSLSTREVALKRRTVDVTAIGPGTAYVSATVGGVSAECRVSVPGTVTGMTPSSDYIRMVEGEEETVSISYSPADAVIDDVEGAVSWTGTLRDSSGKAVTGSDPSDYLEITEFDAYGATLVAKKPGLVDVTASLGNSVSATFHVSVVSRNESKGGVRSLTLPSDYVRMGYPYTRTAFRATTHWGDGTSDTTSDVRWYVGGKQVTATESSFKDAAGLKAVTVGNVLYVTPTEPGSVVVKAESGIDTAATAQTTVEVGGAVTKVTPSASELYLYTGSSTTLTITPDVSGTPYDEYDWTIIDPDEGSAGDKDGILTMRSVGNSTRSKVLIAADVDVDALEEQRDNGKPEAYDAAHKLYDKGARLVVRATNRKFPSVSCDTTVYINLQAEGRQYVKGISLNTDNITLTPPFTNPTTFTARLVDQDGRTIVPAEGNGISWYYYAIGDDTSDLASSKYLLDRSRVTNASDEDASGYVNAYLQENTQYAFITPVMPGYYRLRAVAQSNPQYEAWCTVRVTGDVTAINADCGTSTTLTLGESRDITIQYTPTNALHHNPVFAWSSARERIAADYKAALAADDLDGYLDSYRALAKAGKDPRLAVKSASDTYKDAYPSLSDGPDLLSVIENESTGHVSASLIASADTAAHEGARTSRILYIEYYDDDTTAKLMKTDQGLSGGLTYAEVLAGGSITPLFTRKVVVTLSDPGVLAYKVAVSSAAGTVIDPSSLSGPLEFDVTMSQTGGITASFDRWDLLDADVTTARVAKDASGNVEYASDGTARHIALDKAVWDANGIRQSGSSFFFSVDTSAIPSEPVLLTVSLDEDAAAKAGYGAKVTSGNVLLYIGGTIDSISQAPTTYNLNNNVTTSEGSNVDMISGANATLNIAYNPTNTHQTGVFWTAIESSDTIQARGLNDGSGSQISLYATEVPVTGSTTGKVYSTRLRAVSQYDPLFQRSDIWAPKLDKDGAVVTDGGQIVRWTFDEFRKASGALLANNETVKSTENDSDNTTLDIDAERAKMISASACPEGWAAAATIYCDYNVTVRSPIGNVKFLVAKQAEVSTGTEGGTPSYTTIGDSEETFYNTIRCQLSTLGEKDNATKAYLVTFNPSPDYGYDMNFEISEGRTLGTLDVSDIEKGQFRFIPKDTTRFGTATVTATSPAVNYKQDFTLIYEDDEYALVPYSDESDSTRWWLKKWDYNIRNSWVTDNYKGDYDAAVKAYLAGSDFKDGDGFGSIRGLDQSTSIVLKQHLDSTGAVSSQDSFDIGIVTADPRAAKGKVYWLDTTPLPDDDKKNGWDVYWATTSEVPDAGMADTLENLDSINPTDVAVVTWNPDEPYHATVSARNLGNCYLVCLMKPHDTTDRSSRLTSTRVFVSTDADMTVMEYIADSKNASYQPTRNFIAKAYNVPRACGPYWNSQTYAQGGTGKDQWKYYRGRSSIVFANEESRNAVISNNEGKMAYYPGLGTITGISFLPTAEKFTGTHGLMQADGMRLFTNLQSLAIADKALNPTASDMEMHTVDGNATGFVRLNTFKNLSSFSWTGNKNVGTVKSIVLPADALASLDLSGDGLKSLAQVISDKTTTRSGTTQTVSANRQGHTELTDFETGGRYYKTATLVGGKATKTGDLYVRASGTGLRRPKDSFQTAYGTVDVTETTQDGTKGYVVTGTVTTDITNTSTAFNNVGTVNLYLPVPVVKETVNKVPVGSENLVDNDGSTLFDGHTESSFAIVQTMKPGVDGTVDVTFNPVENRSRDVRVETYKTESTGWNFDRPYGKFTIDPSQTNEYTEEAEEEALQWYLYAGAEGNSPVGGPYDAGSTVPVTASKEDIFRVVAYEKENTSQTTGPQTRHSYESEPDDDGDTQTLYYFSYTVTSVDEYGTGISGTSSLSYRTHEEEPLSFKAQVSVSNDHTGNAVWYDLGEMQFADDEEKGSEMTDAELLQFINDHRVSTYRGDSSTGLGPLEDEESNQTYRLVSDFIPARVSSGSSVVYRDVVAQGTSSSDRKNAVAQMRCRATMEQNETANETFSSDIVVYVDGVATPLAQDSLTYVGPVQAEQSVTLELSIPTTKKEDKIEYTCQWDNASIGDFYVAQYDMASTGDSTVYQFPKLVSLDVSDNDLASGSTLTLDSYDLPNLVDLSLSGNPMERLVLSRNMEKVVTSGPANKAFTVDNCDNLTEATVSGAAAMTGIALRSNKALAKVSVTGASSIEDVDLSNNDISYVDIRGKHSFNASFPVAGRLNSQWNGPSGFRSFHAFGNKKMSIQFKPSPDYILRHHGHGSSTAYFDTFICVNIPPGSLMYATCIDTHKQSKRAGDTAHATGKIENAEKYVDDVNVRDEGTKTYYRGLARSPANSITTRLVLTADSEGPKYSKNKSTVEIRWLLIYPFGMPSDYEPTL